MTQEKSLALEGGYAERFPLCHRRNSWKGNLSFCSVQGEIVSKKAKAVPVTSAVPSLEILLYPGELLEPCDVTCVGATPTALRTFVQWLYSLSIDMLSRLRSLLGIERGEHEETKVRKEGAEPRSRWKTERNKWS